MRIYLGVHKVRVFLNKVMKKIAFPRLSLGKAGTSEVLHRYRHNCIFPESFFQIKKNTK